MIDPRVVHSVTTEACTGFLLLAGAAVIVKLVSDGWLRTFHGRVARLDRWAIAASKFAEPTSYFALVMGVLATFVSMVSGSLAWPADQLVMSEAVHNKILTTVLSQTLFIGAVVIRHRYRSEVWMTRATRIPYAFLVLAGVAFMTLQNSVAGHLAGKGSLLDDLFHLISVDATQMWVFPDWASVLLLVLFPILAGLSYLVLRRQDRALGRTRLPEEGAAQAMP